MIQCFKIKINKFLILGVFLFVAFGFAKAAEAATYYVATTGNDANPGTLSQPFKTIAKAYSQTLPGDTIIVKPGVYTEYQPGYGINLNKSGTASAPIMLKSETKWGAILDGQATSPQTTPYTRQAVLWVGGNYNIVDGFDIRNSPKEGISIWGSSNKIINNNIHNNGNYGDTTYPYGHDGIFSAEYVSNNQYIGNYIHHNGRSSCLGQTPCNHDHGLYLCGDNEVVANNIVGFNSAYGLQIAGYNTVSNMQAYNNIFVSNGRSGAMLWLAVAGINFTNNIFYNNVNFGISSYDAHGSGVVFDHNLFYGNPSGPIDFTNAGSDYAYTSGTSITTNPLFINDTNNFHLQSSSPAINAGATLSEVTTDFDGLSRPQGSAYDIGAYEYVGSPPAGASADLNSDGRVNSVDAAILMGAWGQTTKPKADINQDGAVNSVDASLMMGQWSP